MRRATSLFLLALLLGCRDEGTELDRPPLPPTPAFSAAIVTSESGAVTELRMVPFEAPETVVRFGADIPEQFGLRSSFDIQDKSWVSADPLRLEATDGQTRLHLALEADGALTELNRVADGEHYDASADKRWLARYDREQRAVHLLPTAPGLEAEVVQVDLPPESRGARLEAWYGSTWLLEADMGGGRKGLFEVRPGASPRRLGGDLSLAFDYAGVAGRHILVHHGAPPRYTVVDADGGERSFSLPGSSALPWRAWGDRAVFDSPSTGRILVDLTDPTQQVTLEAFYACELRYCIDSRGPSIGVLDLETGAEVAIDLGERLPYQQRFAFDPAHQRLVVVDLAAHTVEVFDLARGGARTARWPFEVPPDGPAYDYPKFSPDGRWFSYRQRLIDLDSGDSFELPAAPTALTNTHALLPDERPPQRLWLHTSEQPRRWIADVATTEAFDALGLLMLVFPDGLRLIRATAPEVTLWEAPVRAINLGSSQDLVFVQTADRLIWLDTRESPPQVTEQPLSEGDGIVAWPETQSVLRLAASGAREQLRPGLAPRGLDGLSGAVAVASDDGTPWLHDGGALVRPGPRAGAADVRVPWPSPPPDHIFSVPGRGAYAVTWRAEPAVTAITFDAPETSRALPGFSLRSPGGAPSTIYFWQAHLPMDDLGRLLSLVEDRVVAFDVDGEQEVLLDPGPDVQLELVDGLGAGWVAVGRGAEGREAWGAAPGEAPRRVGSLLGGWGLQWGDPRTLATQSALGTDLIDTQAGRLFSTEPWFPLLHLEGAHWICTDWGRLALCDGAAGTAVRLDPEQVSSGSVVQVLR